jgi:phenylpropionate dioxygenase-like ring-hydroxylating dioxygenase large terminal subunit
MMSPFAAELEPYRLEALEPRGSVVLRPRAANWKNIADNYGDGLHIPVAHPGLSRLFAGTYALEASPYVDKMSGSVVAAPSTNWSERHYQGLLGAFDHLSPENQRLWRYYRLWPNTAFDIYPDQVDFMQLIPVSATQTLIREIAYALPDARREVRAARYLNWRINRQVNAEDTVLIQRIQDGMASSSYVSGPLSAAEPCLGNFARLVRAAVPEALSHDAPRRPPGKAAAS